jgi:hypothetical protein
LTVDIAMSWHDLEWFMQFFANPLAAIALLAVTGWYAWTTRRILKANEEGLAETRLMVAATKQMAETSERTYLASLIPDLSISSVEASSQGTSSFAKGVVTNRGRERVKIVKLRADAGSGLDGQTFEKSYDAWLLPREDLSVFIDCTKPGVRNTRLEVEDIAGKTHLFAFKRDAR